jgi:chloramphenicol 3-O-phosphotransferase
MATDCGAAHDQRRCTTVIADGHVFVVGEEWILRTEETADACGVMDGGVEVGVVGRFDGLEKGCRRLGRERGGNRIAGGLVGEGIEQVHETGAQ